MDFKNTASIHACLLCCRDNHGHSQAFRIVEDFLVFPVKPRQFIRIQLHKRALEVLRNVKLGSITITPNTIHTAYSRMVGVNEPKGWVAIDLTPHG